MQISSRVRPTGEMLPRKLLGLIVHGLYMYLLPAIMIVFFNQVYLQVSAESKVNICSCAEEKLSFQIHCTNWHTQPLLLLLLLPLQLLLLGKGMQGKFPMHLSATKQNTDG